MARVTFVVRGDTRITRETGDQPMTAIRSEKVEATAVITTLFQRWMEMPETLPQHQQRMVEESSLPQVVADYIAGMTDEFILRLYEAV